MGTFDLWVVSAAGGEAVQTRAFEVFRRAGLDLGVSVLGCCTPVVWEARRNQIIFSAFSGDATNLWRIPFSQGGWQIADTLQQLTVGTGETGPSVASDGRLVFSNLTSIADLWSLPIDADEGKVVGLLERVAQDLASDSFPTVTADGKTLVFISDRSGNQDVWMKNLASGAEAPLVASPLPEDRAVISPNGFKLAVKRFEDDKRTIYFVRLNEGVEEKVCEGCGLLIESRKVL